MFSLITMATLVVIPIPRLVIAYYFLRLDGAAGVREHGQDPAGLHGSRTKGKRCSPTITFLPTSSSIAGWSRRDRRVDDRVSGGARLEHDQYARLIEAPSAHASETAILRLFWWLWIIVFSFSALHFGWHLVHPEWRPGWSIRSGLTGKP